MRLWMVAAATAALALAAGCDRDARQSPFARTPATASGGASSESSGVRTGPTGEQIKPPEAPSGSASADTKPDPGDANDHSTPEHDSRNKKNAD